MRLKRNLPSSGTPRATADFFPRFSLTGSLGTSGSQPKDLVSWDNRFWSIGPSVIWLIFNAGRIRANIGVQSAIQEKTLVAYRDNPDGTSGRRERAGR